MTIRSIFAAILVTTVSLGLTVLADAATQTSVSNVNVTASILGSKPLVYNLSPTSGANSGATAITAVVGRNFTGATIVTLDDANSTVLATNPTVVSSTDNDATVAGVGASGTYQKITGLSIPSGLTPGLYNILVTTSSGTNIASDVRFTVSAPVATGAPNIVSVDPNPVITEVSTTANVSLTATDSNTTPINYSITQNGGTWDAASGTIALTSNSGTKALVYTADVTDGVFTNTFSVDDGGVPTTKNVLFYLQPGGW